MPKNDLQKCFGNRMKQLRRGLGVTQSRLAEISGISEEYLSKIERGLASPSFDVITRLADGVRATPMELFGSRAPLTDGQDPAGPLLVADEALRAVFGKAPLGMFVSTQGGRLRMATDAMAAMLGYRSGKEMTAKVDNIARQLYPRPEYRDWVLSLVPSNGKMFVCECPLQHRDGHAVSVHLGLRRCPLPGEPLVSYAGFVSPLDDHP